MALPQAINRTSRTRFYSPHHEFSLGNQYGSSTPTHFGTRHENGDKLKHTISNDIVRSIKARDSALLVQDEDGVRASTTPTPRKSGKFPAIQQPEMMPTSKSNSADHLIALESTLNNENEFFEQNNAGRRNKRVQLEKHRHHQSQRDLFQQRLQEQPQALHTQKRWAGWDQNWFSNQPPPIMRFGRNGSCWRHVKQCTGYLGNWITFIDGNVKLGDCQRYPPHGLPETSLTCNKAANMAYQNRNNSDDIRFSRFLN